MKLNEKSIVVTGASSGMGKAIVERFVKEGANVIAVARRKERLDELRERIGEIEPGKRVYVICQSGLRSYIATRILEGYGFEAYNFAGGFRFYDAVVNDRALIEAAYSCGMDQ